MSARWRQTLWRILGRPLFAATPHTAHGLRRAMLRAAGARVAPNAKIRRSADIDYPANLTLGPLSIVGDDAFLRLASPLSVGARSVISQRCIVSTEIVDPEDPSRTRRHGIELGDDCWIAADTLVLPGARVGEGSVVGARGVVVGDLPPWAVCVGMPATPRRERRFLTDAERSALAGATP